MTKDPVVQAVNELLVKSIKGEKKVKKTVESYLGYSVNQISELIRAFEKVSSDRAVIEAMESNARRKYGELGRRMVELTIRNSMAMLKLREIAEKENLRKVEDRQKALEIIDDIFGSRYDYIDLLDDMITIEELIGENKNAISKFFSRYITKKYRKKLEILEKELTQH